MNGDEETKPPFRRAFDVARDPYSARNALGLIGPGGGPFQPLDADLTAIAGLTGTNTIYYRSAASTWSPVSMGANMTFSGGVLNSTGGGGGAPIGADYLVRTADATLTAERVVTDTTTIIWDWSTAGQAKATRAALTGDVTSPANSTTTTLATVNANVGTFQGITVNGKGLVTAAVNQGYITGNQTITLSGDVTGTGTTAITATIANDAVTNAKLANMTAPAFKGRTTAGTGDPEDLTPTQATALLNVFTSTLNGLAPLSGGGTANYLRADGTWAVPPGAGSTTPTRQTFASGSGTYTTPGSVKWLRIRLVGGGGGGAGSGVTTVTNGTAGGNTTFGTLTGGGGGGGNVGGAAGTGGTASGGNIGNWAGADGFITPLVTSTASTGGHGGDGLFGGGGGGGVSGGNGSAGKANTGGGGGGAGSTGGNLGGSGGGGGGGVEHVIASPAATYSYSVGAAGGAGAAGTGGWAGAAGSVGYIIVEEFY